MQLNITQEEKRGIVISTLNKYEPLTSVNKYIDYINIDTIIRDFIEIVDKNINILTNNEVLKNYDYIIICFDPNNDMDNNYDWDIEITDSIDMILSMMRVLVGECASYDSFWEYHALLFVKFVEKHIINELKKTDIPPVLQTIMIEYAF